jgi:hypothetical protein
MPFRISGPRWRDSASKLRAELLALCPLRGSIETVCSVDQSAKRTFSRVNRTTHWCRQVGAPMHASRGTRTRFDDLLVAPRFP